MQSANNPDIINPHGIDTLDIELRDYFAAQCLSALLPQSHNPYEIANWAYRIADALIEVREREE